MLKDLSHELYWQNIGVLCFRGHVRQTGSERLIPLASSHKRRGVRLEQWFCGLSNDARESSSNQLTRLPCTLADPCRRHMTTIVLENLAHSEPVTRRSGCFVTYFKLCPTYAEDSKILTEIDLVSGYLVNVVAYITNGKGRLKLARTAYEVVCAHPIGSLYFTQQVEFSPLAKESANRYSQLQSECSHL